MGLKYGPDPEAESKDSVCSGSPEVLVSTPTWGLSRGCPGPLCQLEGQTGLVSNFMFELGVHESPASNFMLQLGVQETLASSLLCQLYAQPSIYGPATIQPEVDVSSSLISK